MKNLLIGLCCLVSLSVLSLHAASSQPQNTDSTFNDNTLHHTDRPVHPDDTAIQTSSHDVEARRFVAINFSAPLHVPGQKPTTGNGSIMPFGLTGNPQVVAATPVLQNQPLLLNSDLANGPCCYEEGIQVLVGGMANHYVISFDMASQKLGDSFNQFQLWLNDNDAPLLRFQSDHLLVLEGTGAIASFRDDHLLHVQIDLDIVTQQISITINGNLLYTGSQPLAPLQSLQFLMTIEGGATPEQVNPEATIALDNIVVANSAYRYANLQSSLQSGAGSQHDPDGRRELVARVLNLSNHAAHQLTLTLFLPSGVSIVDIQSDFLECDLAAVSLICHADQLPALTQTQVAFQVTGLNQAKAGSAGEITAIATSSTEEIDNYDNQVKTRFGGSGSLLLMLALLLLWWMRNWNEHH